MKKILILCLICLFLVEAKVKVDTENGSLSLDIPLFKTYPLENMIYNSANAVRMLQESMGKGVISLLDQHLIFNNDGSISLGSKTGKLFIYKGYKEDIKRAAKELRGIDKRKFINKQHERLQILENSNMIIPLANKVYFDSNNPYNKLFIYNNNEGGIDHIKLALGNELREYNNKGTLKKVIKDGQIYRFNYRDGYISSITDNLRLRTYYFTLNSTKRISEIKYRDNKRNITKIIKIKYDPKTFRPVYISTDDYRTLISYDVAGHPKEVVEETKSEKTTYFMKFNKTSNWITELKKLVVNKKRQSFPEEIVYKYIYLPRNKVFTSRKYTTILSEKKTVGGKTTTSTTRFNYTRDLDRKLSSLSIKKGKKSIICKLKNNKPIYIKRASSSLKSNDSYRYDSEARLIYIQKPNKTIRINYTNNQVTKIIAKYKGQPSTVYDVEYKNNLPSIVHEYIGTSKTTLRFEYNNSGKVQTIYYKNIPISVTYNNDNQIKSIFYNGKRAVSFYHTSYGKPRVYGASNLGLVFKVKEVFDEYDWIKKYTQPNKIVLLRS